jgi:hypothetical protein
MLWKKPAIDLPDRSLSVDQKEQVTPFSEVYHFCSVPPESLILQKNDKQLKPFMSPRTFSTH